MLIGYPQALYLICDKTDLRRGIDGLTGVIQEEYQLDPYSSAFFLFCGTRKDRFKTLYWAGDGFILFYKRIEDGRLQWPTNQSEVKKLHVKQLERLLSGWGLESTVNQCAVDTFIPHPAVVTLNVIFFHFGGPHDTASSIPVRPGAGRPPSYDDPLAQLR